MVSAGRHWLQIQCDVYRCTSLPLAIVIAFLGVGIVNKAGAGTSWALIGVNITPAGPGRGLHPPPLVENETHNWNCSLLTDFHLLVTLATTQYFPAPALDYICEIENIYFLGWMLRNVLNSPSVSGSQVEV